MAEALGTSHDARPRQYSPSTLSRSCHGATASTMACLGELPSPIATPLVDTARLPGLS